MGLIAELNQLQQEHGYLQEAELRSLSQRLNVPLYRLQGLATFYPHFRTSPPTAAEVAVCRDMSCHLAGAEELMAAVDSELAGDVTAGSTEVHRVSCLGRCDNAPAACVNGVPLPADCPAAAGARAAKLAAWARQPDSIPADEPVTSGRAFKSDPYPDVKSRYGYLRRFLAEKDQAAAGGRLLDTLKAAGLRGMGGAGFPTATKWDLVRQQSEAERYVVVNADESEPGTFKDRVILEELPHLMLEGALLAAAVAGAGKVIVYIRHEYDKERRALVAELDRARNLGLEFDVEIFVSPGGYILGEETALLEALEDRRGEPRNKPPFPVTHGLFGRPTVINNVETLALVPAILTHGAEWWTAQGRDGFAGLKFIALSGHVENPGVYEIATGTSIGELIEMGGGISGGRPLAAIAPGGASSRFLPPSATGVALDFKSVEEAGSMLGSGAVVVVAEGTDLLALAANVVAFFRNESCGKCVPCRTGSEKAVKILEAVLDGRGDRVAVELLPQLGETLLLTSICGLGQVALNPILSLLEHFPDHMGSRLPGGTSA